MQIAFTVPGVPAPQGSKVRTRWGMREDNPNTRPWRQAVAWEATAAMRAADMDALLGPLALEVVFYFPRPKSHYRTGRLAGVLKDSAPDFHTAKPDADKLLRAIGDALTGLVVRDDSHFAVVRAEKTYGEPRALILVRELEETANENAHKTHPEIRPEGAAA